MADTKISDLTEITTLDGTEEFVVADTGTTKKITAANVLGDVGIELVEDQHLAADAASISFQNIPQTYTHLSLLLAARGDAASTSTVLVVRFNNDTGSNYDWEQLIITSNVTLADQGTGVTFMQAGSIPAANAPANVFGALEIKILDYTDTATRKTLLASGLYKTADATDGHFRTANAGFYRTAGAVSRIDLIPGTPDLVAGSRATLYGLR